MTLFWRHCKKVTTVTYARTSQHKIIYWWKQHSTLLKIPGKHFLCLVKKLNSHQAYTRRAVMEGSRPGLATWFMGLGLVSSLKGLGHVSVSRFKGLGLAQDYSIETTRPERRKKAAWMVRYRSWSRSRIMRQRLHHCRRARLNKQFGNGTDTLLI